MKVGVIGNTPRNINREREQERSCHNKENESEQQVACARR